MDENKIETEAVEEIAKVSAGMSKGVKFGIVGGIVAAVGTGVATVFIMRKMKKNKALKQAAEDLAFRNAKVVEGDFAPESEVK